MDPLMMKQGQGEDDRMQGLMEIFTNYRSELVQGLIITLQLTLVGLGFGGLLGLFAALGKIYGSKWVRPFAVGFIDIIRGTPLLVQLFVVYFGLPQIGITLPRMSAAFLVLAINSAAYQAEYFRGAIQAIGSGQMMAARSIGMTRVQAVRNIILPQAARIVIPAWSNEPISLLKASAVVFLIAVPDLMTQAKIIAARTYAPIETYIIVAVFYLAVVFALSSFLVFAEKRLRIPGLEMDAQRV
jgi:polar amino acid transport system permease protein